MSLTILTALFASTALLYASVGFGGGSTYLTILVMADTDYLLLAPLALICNVIVVAGGVSRFSRSGIIPWRRAIPLVAASVPCAFVAGYVPIPRTVFVGLLGMALALASAALLLPLVRRPTTRGRSKPDGARSDLAVTGLTRSGLGEMAVGGMLGTLAGFVGIGGGILLAPVLHLTRWADARTIAGVSALFILVNSLSGIGGQAAKLMGTGSLAEIASFWPLGLAVLVGGQIGSHAAITVWSEPVLRAATAALTLFVALRMLAEFARQVGSTG